MSPSVSVSPWHVKFVVNQPCAQVIAADCCSSDRFQIFFRLRQLKQCTLLVHADSRLCATHYFGRSAI